MNKKTAILIVTLLTVGLGASADCPPGPGDPALAGIEVGRDRLLTFPVVAHEGDEITHQGSLRACVVDAASGKPLAGVEFLLVPYRGRVHEGRGPERLDLQYFNPAGPLSTAGKVVEVATSAAGEIRQGDLRIGQYALVPDWSSTAADDLRVHFQAVSTLAVDVPIALLTDPGRE